MVKIYLFTFVICIGCLLSVVNSAKAKCIDTTTNNVTEKIQSVYLIDTYVEKEKNDLKDCTITIKDDNGTNLEVTFHDITWFECAKIKVVKWFKDTF